MFNSDQEELEFYRSVHRKMNASIYILNLNPYTLDWVVDNEVLNDVLGLSQEDVIAQGDFIASRVLSNPDFQESVDLAVSQFQDNPDMKWTGVYRIMHEDGTLKWVTYTTKTLEKNAKGEAIKAICVAFESGNLFNTPRTLDSYIKHVKSKRYQHIKDTLTERQVEVIKGISDGKTEQEIAEFLQISIHTVKDHKLQLYKKLECANTKELYALAQNYEFFP